MQTISAVFAKALIEAVGFSKIGVTETRINTPASHLALSNEAHQIPLKELNDFLFELQRRIGSEDVGLLAYKKAHPGNLGVLGYAIMSSPTIHSALKSIKEFYPLVGTGFCMFLEEQPTEVRFVGVSADISSPMLPRVFIDAIASITLGLLHWLTPTVRFMPVKAEFTYSRPRDTRLLEEMFGTGLEFDSAVNALTFRRCDTDLPVATFDASLQKIHNDHLERKKREVTCDCVIERVKSVVLQHLHQTKPLTVDVISRSMGLSTFQLTRLLETVGARFQMLVDSARLQHSHHLLINTSLPLKQVSYSLGFRSQSALNKACERWFGMSPGRYRVSGASSSSPP